LVILQNKKLGSCNRFMPIPAIKIWDTSSAVHSSTEIEGYILQGYDAVIIGNLLSC
jgi:hypothetical protein